MPTVFALVLIVATYGERPAVLASVPLASGLTAAECNATLDRSPAELFSLHGAHAFLACQPADGR